MDFRPSFLLSLYLEGVLIKAAYGADPVSGNVLPRCAGSDAVVGIAKRRIVFITTRANIFHNCNSFLVL